MLKLAVYYHAAIVVLLSLNPEIRAWENGMTNKSAPESYFFVTVPYLPCTDDEQCYEPGTVCQQERCMCNESLCWVYHFETYGWWSGGRLIFECGECGVLGSQCYSEHLIVHCNEPGLCSEDGFCHCPFGEHYKSYCMVVYFRLLRGMMLIGFSFIFFMAVIIVVYQCCCGRRYARGRNIFSWRESSETASNNTVKSPAYTFQIQFLSHESYSADRSSEISSQSSSDNATVSQRSEYQASQNRNYWRKLALIRRAISSLSSRTQSSSTPSSSRTNNLRGSSSLITAVSKNYFI